ncbi:hypothetical protein HOT49_gp329 [Erwinia phage vB_EamM_Alexandra]|uniref:Uncharacterized protein n=1 Tax=Erwinia phage vB_EamM_Alexandra TaxID=2201424 RepID=A0A2Z4QF84_9CAUD|nr:hypothetical protein HOT49_gp329 [Erwinia phage vB_EamM_Alexandra]AWY08584.1 hypothetical protein Alexandra_333 [Erwinia phage vB_EamM_Alexandra]
MFYDHVFNHDEKQLLLSVAESKYLVRLDCPDYLKKSKHSIEIRHTVTNRGEQRRSGVVNTTFVPRIHTSTVQRLVREIRDSAGVAASTSLAALFELGLGVPKQRDIATYLRDYSRENDKKGVGIKYIRKLINEYHRKHRHSFAGSRWLMPAVYTANMLNMQSFIHLKEDGYSKKVKVPDGLPVVLIYQNTNHAKAEFTLCDAFMISPLGYPMPFAQIALRPEFKGAPKVFHSKALRGQGMYSMVMGIMHWEKGDALSHFRELTAIDDDPYLTLLSNPQYADRRSPEYQALLDKRAEYAEQRQEHNEVIAKYGNTTRALKPSQVERLEKAEEFFKERKSFMDDFDKFEKKENHHAAKKFSVASAQFAAVDCGTIADRSTYMSVASGLDKVNKILTKWGFTTVDTVNSSLKKSILTFDPTNATRVWSL